MWNLLCGCFWRDQPHHTRGDTPRTIYSNNSGFGGARRGQVRRCMHVRHVLGVACPACTLLLFECVTACDAVSERARALPVTR